MMVVRMDAFRYCCDFDTWRFDFDFAFFLNVSLRDGSSWSVWWDGKEEGRGLSDLFACYLSLSGGWRRAVVDGWKDACMHAWWYCGL